MYKKAENPAIIMLTYVIMLTIIVTRTCVKFRSCVVSFFFARMRQFPVDNIKWNLAGKYFRKQLSGLLKTI